jgi:SAM-dependent methyltransferase
MTSEPQREHLCHIEDLPFTVAPSRTPHNPLDLPDVLPFDLCLNRELGLLEQPPNPTVMQHLETAYRAASTIGSAMDDTGLGRLYADDFVSYMTEVCDITDRRILEIGAGRGYLVRRLTDLGGNAIGIEPGLDNASHWRRHRVNVIAEYFPSPQAPGPFDVIVAHGVLEHVPTPKSFLAEVQAHLAPCGHFLAAVPDCTEPVASGDPSMLVHEHFSYFTEGSLRRALEANGLRVTDLRKAGFGGALHVAATPGKTGAGCLPAATELAEARAFGDKLRRLRARFQSRLDATRAAGKRVGIYCPARALALLDSAAGIRFFDDDPELHGKFYPPFGSPVEPRSALLGDPVDELWIMSRTFGPKLREQLRREPALRGCRIRLPGDFMPAGELTSEDIRK